MSEASHIPGVAGLERAIVDRGRAILARVEPERLVTLSPAWWQERLLEWATGDPEFRVKLLRFVDVLPSLRSAREIADHVRQYFRDDSPAVVRIGAEVGRSPPFRPVLSQVVRRSVFAMAGRFIVAASPEEALPRLRRLVEGGTGFTVDLLGEATLSHGEAEAYRRRYLHLLKALEPAAEWDAPPELRQPNISIKLSALTPHFEPAAPEATYRSLEPGVSAVLEAARLGNAFVNVDMEQHRFRDLTHQIFEQLALDSRFRDWSGLGIVVQAYLTDAEDDLARMQSLAERRGAPIRVRLVKGAYWDEEVIVAGQNGHRVPVFEEKAATDRSFERCTERLLAAHPHLLPSFASHNPRGIAQAMVRSELAGVPRRDVEFQMLFGMAEGLRRAVQEEGYRTRVYVPAGEIIPGMAYLVRRLLENTTNQSWLLSKHERVDADIALEEPRPLGRSSSEARFSSRLRFGNHPPLELHLPPDRARMHEAVARVRDGFGRDYPIRVAGESIRSDRWLEIRPPAAPAELMGRAGSGTSEHVDAAVSAGRLGFSAWRDETPAARAAVLRRAADLMAERRAELAAVMVFESGKPWREADGDVIEAIDFLRYHAAEAERLGPGLDLTSVPGETNAYVYEARGVVAVISPWNFPLAIPCGMVSAALAAGNAVVLKPAHQSPIIAWRLVSILHEAGVPPDVLSYVPGLGPEAGESLVEHPDVDMVAFTGGNVAGRRIALACAEVRPGQRGLKKLIAELGGKNAVIVDDDADLDLAVEGVLRSAFGYAGQKCSAASRVIVVGSAYREFRDRLAAAVESLVVGPPEDPATYVPPVISAEALARIEEYIRIGKGEGKLVAKGPRPDGEGHYVAPHVFEDVPRASRLAREEVFGPVLALFRAATFREAVEIALDSDFALTGGVFSRSPRNVDRATRRFRVGNLYLNRPTTRAMVGRQPFGGFHMSGTGDKAGGPDYLRVFMLARVVTENTMRRGFAPPSGPRAGGPPATPGLA
jgi:RHH-type proline utilization regulon transcriptional repressor/proline dehydrogenase/delta 1-pyrroline-5-carboxylate dehydrogenase